MIEMIGIFTEKQFNCIQIPFGRTSVLCYKDEKFPGGVLLQRLKRKKLANEASHTPLSHG